MSFDAVENSNYEGRPIVLYRFALGETFWAYTNSDIDIECLGENYEAVAISDNGYSQSGDPQTEDFNLTVPVNLPIVDLFKGTPPSDPVYLTMRLMHEGEEDAPVVWVGTVASVAPEKSAKAVVVAQMITATFDTAGLRQTWGRGCPHALYDMRCKVDKTLFVVNALVTNVSGSAFEAAAAATKPAGHFNNGFLEWDSVHGFVERRAIERHEGSTIHLLGLADGIQPGMSVRLYPGCLRIRSDCNGKFNNIQNYGGFAHMPGKSPFDGDPVF